MRRLAIFVATVVGSVAACGRDAPAPCAAPPVTPPIEDGAPPPATTRFSYTRFGVNHILSTGQSLAVGAASTAESVKQPYGNLMLAFGVQASAGFSGPFAPLVESGVETMSSALANALTDLALTDGIPLVSLVSVHGGGGTPYSGVKKGTALYQRGLDQVSGALERTKVNGQSYVVRAVTSVHGESDSLAKSTTYEADIIQWQVDYETDVQRLTGQTLPVPMFHTQNSQQAESRIPFDMLAAHIAAPGKVILVGPKYHLTYSDGTHLTTSSYKHLGEDYAKAYRRVVLEGGTWEPVRPKTITRDGATILIVFHVPVPPLVLDTTLVPANDHYGFGYVDATADPAKPRAPGQDPVIERVEVIAPDTVRITLSSVPIVPGRIRYAVDYVGNTGPHGNLRDSDATPSRFGFDLSNWGVQFEEDIPWEVTPPPGVCPR